jgi:CheY-like chemotaxis protein
MPHKLLLADDSVTIQRVIELTFADEDVQVIAVGDGQKAIERIEAERPDIVLADVGMPERDGYEVAAFVKNTAHLAHIPVLLLTGAFEPVDVQRASSAGCDGVLAKPFEPHMVITRVKELLAGSPGQRVPQRGPAVVATLKAPAAEPAEGAPTEAAEAPDLGPGFEAEPPPAPAASTAADTPVRISRRTPIAVPGFGAPTPPPESLAALDEYFDRLEGAFATLQQSPAVAADATAPVPETPGFVSAEAPPADTLSPAGAEPADVAARELEVTAAQAAKGPPASAAPTPAPQAQLPGIAQAFSALFAAERGETSVVPTFAGSAAPPQASVDDLVERVTRQVLERLSDRVVRDTVSDIVSRVAERLVRDEIERVKATLK